MSCFQFPWCGHSIVSEHLLPEFGVPQTSQAEAIQNTQRRSMLQWLVYSQSCRWSLPCHVDVLQQSGSQGWHSCLQTANQWSFQCLKKHTPSTPDIYTILYLQYLSLQHFQVVLAPPPPPAKAPPAVATLPKHHGGKWVSAGETRKSISAWKTFKTCMLGFLSIEYVWNIII